MKSFKYIAVLILYSFLLVLDFLFVLTTIGMAFDDKDASVSDGAQVGAVVVCAVISAFLIFLTVKCRSYSKKLDKIKDDAPEIKKVDVPKPSGDAVCGPASNSASKSGKYAGIGCFVIAIPIVSVCIEGWERWLCIATIVFIIWGLATGSFAEKSTKNKGKSNELKAFDNLVDDDDDGCDEPLWTSGSNFSDSKPNYEIKYKDAEGNISVRKIFVRDFDGRVLDAYCFLRNDDRTFYVPRIVECVDLETGEVLSNGKCDLRWYFNERFKKNFKPSDMFEYDEWVKTGVSSCTPFVDDISGFDVDDDFRMKILTYKDGEISGRFHCGKVYSSMYDGFYMSLIGDNGNSYNVEPNKIISVEGVEDIGKFINEKFLNSKEGKARRLQKECEDELSIFVYLGRADDASINEKKRNVICNYLQNTGRECTNELLAVVSKRIKVDTSEFKKIVNVFSKSIDPSKKPLFLAAVNEIVGGKEKAKPFGLAGLQYIESKIKV